jgi:hypothetical protein
MPKKNMSLTGGLTRYHRIGSPTDPARVLGDRPLECALCHGDKSVEELASTMERWWPERYDRAILRATYGDLSTPVLRATLERGKPHEKAVALSLLGERRDRTAGEAFLGELDDPYPLLRQYAGDALRSTYGAACDLDFAAAPARRERAVERCARAAGLSLPRHEAPVRAPDGEPAED